MSAHGRCKRSDHNGLRLTGDATARKNKTEDKDNAIVSAVMLSKVAASLPDDEPTAEEIAIQKAMAAKEQQK